MTLIESTLTPTGNLETDKQHVLNISTDLNGISIRSRKPENRKKTNFAECYRTRKTTSWEEVKEKIKVIKAPVIPVEPHEYTSLARGNYVCNHCQRACNKLDNLKRHIKQIHRKTPTMYQCPYCPYKSKWSVEDHIILKHKHTKDIQCFRYRCDMCDYETFIRQNLNNKLNHLKLEEIQYFHCSYCFYKSTRKCHLKAHVFRHFKNVEIEHEKRHRCDQCSYKTYKHSHLKTHKLIHLKPEEIQYFYCYHCSYKSKQKSHLKIHILRHFEKEETKFHCYMCDFMTLKRELIIDHIRRHSKV